MPHLSTKMLQKAESLHKKAKPGSILSTKNISKHPAITMTQKLGLSPEHHVIVFFDPVIPWKIIPAFLATDMHF